MNLDRLILKTGFCQNKTLMDFLSGNHVYGSYLPSSKKVILYLGERWQTIKGNYKHKVKKFIKHYIKDTVHEIIHYYQDKLTGYGLKELLKTWDDFNHVERLARLMSE